MRKFEPKRKEEKTGVKKLNDEILYLYFSQNNYFVIRSRTIISAGHTAQ